MEHPPLLEAQAIGRRRSQGDRWLIRNVSLSLHAGQRLAVCGPSGAGKTVLLRALALLDRVDEGAIRWRGAAVQPAEAPGYRSQVMYLHQQCVCWEGSVRENLVRPWRFRQHRDRGYSESLVIEQLAITGRDAAFLDKRALDLSGGERQVMAVIRAVQLRPTVLLLDEPTASLDEATTRQVEELVETWRTERRACVWVSHSREQAARVADQVIEWT